MINSLRTRVAEVRAYRRFKRERKATFKRCARELYMYDLVYRTLMGDEGDA